MINDTRPLLLGSAIKDNNLNYYVDLTNPDFFDDGTIVLAKDTLHIARTMYLHDGALRERVAITNHGNQVTRFTLSFTFAADFADIFEVRGMHRPQSGRAWTELLTAGSVAIAYRCLDGTLPETAVSFEPFPLLLKDGYASYALELAPGARAASTKRRRLLSIFSRARRSVAQSSAARSSAGPVQSRMSSRSSTSEAD